MTPKKRALHISAMTDYDWSRTYSANIFNGYTSSCIYATDSHRCNKGIKLITPPISLNAWLNDTVTCLDNYFSDIRIFSFSLVL